MLPSELVLARESNEKCVAKSSLQFSFLPGSAGSIGASALALHKRTYLQA